MTVFLTSDHHFGHKNIIKYCNRPFGSSLEMDEEMILRWNSVVTPKDTVYHLGDFTLGKFDQFFSWIVRLNGSIFIVPGGHDKEWMRRYIDVHRVTILPPIASIHKNKITLCHYPMREWEGSYHGSIHFHGHSHGNSQPRENSMDVGVDCLEFRPVALEDALSLIRLRNADIYP